MKARPMASHLERGQNGQVVVLHELNALASLVYNELEDLTGGRAEIQHLIILLRCLDRFSQGVRIWASEHNLIAQFRYLRGRKIR
jgi:hypothetical protein